MTNIEKAEKIMYIWKWAIDEIEGIIRENLEDAYRAHDAEGIQLAHEDKEMVLAEALEKTRRILKEEQP